jgi:cardiolipin synthase
MTAPTPSHNLVNLPNIISLARLCAVPVAVWLVLRGAYAPAFGIFTAAGISDAIDGWLARRQGGTALGAVLDPLADKVLMVAMYVTLAAMGKLPDWLAILVVFRDVLIIGGILLLWMVATPPGIAPLAVSKANTAMQIMLVGAVLGAEGFGFAHNAICGAVIAALIVLVAISTLVSGAAYVVSIARGPAA